jgi:putative flippase GtrA
LGQFCAGARLGPHIRLIPARAPGTLPRVKNLALIIPAYQPAATLPAMVAALVRDDLFALVVVVDDGSSADRRPLFDAVAALPRVQVVRHAVNLGKGAALKTGLNHAAVHRDDLAGAVTADADGQHAVEDVLAVGRALAETPDKLILGARSFGPEVPWRSRFGNTFTHHTMRFIGGWRITDTQTGLRGIPRAIWPALLRLRTTGYEFELDMLLVCKREGVGVREVPIRTIYLDGNASSHFDPILDSMRIYFVLLRFFAASLTSAVVDNLVFVAVYWPTHSILASQAAARVVSGSVNFLLNKNLVFQSRGSNRVLALRYVALVVFSGLLTYALIRLLVSAQVPVVPAKILAEVVVFMVNFLLQRDLVFHSAAGENGDRPRP